MRKLRIIIALALIALTLAACDQVVENTTSSAGEDEVVALKLYFDIICDSLSSLQENAGSDYYTDDHGCTYSSSRTDFYGHVFTYIYEDNVYLGSFTGTVSTSDGYYYDISQMICNGVAVSMILSYSASSRSFSGSCVIDGNKYSLTPAQVYEIFGEHIVYY